MPAKRVPEDYPVITPYLCVKGAAAAIDFYKHAFGATERMCIGAPGGKIGHAELNIGGARLMLADEYSDMDFRSPDLFGGTPITIHLYVVSAAQQ